ncbi:MAG: terminase large subunit domain-containing protein [Candidatus Thorarchaeota archaeon]
MSEKDKEELLNILEAKEINERYRKYYTVYFQDHRIDPLTGLDVSRNKYPKFCQLMAASSHYKELASIAPNRAGKTNTGGFFLTAQAIKDYPEWWEGKRFGNYPCKFAFIGENNLSVRNVGQDILVGTKNDPGSGMIPNAKYNNGVGLVESNLTSKHGVQDAIMDIWVRDIYGNMNQILLLSRTQSPDVIQGMSLHGIWFDEDALDKDGWYQEAFSRTGNTEGFILCTFTPWPAGMTPAILNFMPRLQFPENNIGPVLDDEGENTEKFCMNMTLDEVPHLTEKMKNSLKKKYHGREYDARILGIPPLGSGAVFQRPLKDILVPTFQIPEHWPRAYGLDFGFVETAIIWIAKNPETNVYYIYAESILKELQTTPYTVVSTIKMKEDWIPGICDPSGGGRNSDGVLVMNQYERLGLKLSPGVNAVTPGITYINTLLETDCLKIMLHVSHIQEEYVQYRYDEMGRIARNQDDHGLDAIRYCLSIFDYVAKTKESHKLETFSKRYNINQDRDSLTGY